MQNCSNTAFSSVKRLFFGCVFTIPSSEIRPKSPFHAGKAGHRATFTRAYTGLHFGSKNRISPWKFQCETNRGRGKNGLSKNSNTKAIVPKNMGERERLRYGTSCNRQGGNVKFARFALDVRGSVPCLCRLQHEGFVRTSINAGTTLGTRVVNHCLFVCDDDRIKGARRNTLTTTVALVQFYCYCHNGTPQSLVKSTKTTLMRAVNAGYSNSVFQFRKRGICFREYALERDSSVHRQLHRFMVQSFLDKNETIP